MQSYLSLMGAQWPSGRVLDSRPKGRGFEPHWHHCVVSLSKNINPSLVLVQPRKTRPFITERLLMGCKESNQTKSNKNLSFSIVNHVISKHYAGSQVSDGCSLGYLFTCSCCLLKCKQCGSGSGPTNNQA